MIGTVTEQLDSLKVQELEDGSFNIEWDTDDPVWSFLNDLTEEERSEWFNKAIEQGLEKYKKSWIIPVEEDSITGEQFLTFSKESLEEIGWKEGDMLQWIDNLDGTFTVKKVSC